ncbi:MAG TPA: hypothetical protein VGF60_08650 [Xanthobacteraceae bacterium]|jgi:hypothetical protein
MFGMSLHVSRILTLTLAVLVLEAASASARTKKSATPSTTTTTCYGTPVIMQGLDCPRRPARVEEPEHAGDRPHRPRVTSRGSGGTYVAPLPRTPSLSVPQSTGPYIPPPVNNPSERVMQYNHSFPFNAGIGNNPSDRDAYIRYNLNR